MAPSRRSWQRGIRKGNTTQRGYGRPHQAERERRLAAYRPGDICAHGGEPMTWPPLRRVAGKPLLVGIARRWLHLPHNDTRTGYLPGLSCSYHNAQDGARRGNRARWGMSAWQSARSW